MSDQDQCVACGRARNNHNVRHRFVEPVKGQAAMEAQNEEKPKYKFELGQVVFLNSGSPRLTVTQQRPNPIGLEYAVTWIGADYKPQHAVLPEACLTDVRPRWERAEGSAR